MWSQDACRLSLYESLLGKEITNDFELPECLWR